jgi:hypothetical protein
MYVYEGEDNRWRVGAYIGGKFLHDGDYDSREEAAARVNYLNGGDGKPFAQSGAKK